ncbi:MAG: hypothetical protein AAGA85_13390 [Bacteroidota bacterium]
MKKLLSLLAFAGLLIFISCSDDDGPAPAGDLTIEGIPATATVGLDETLEVTGITLTAGDGLDAFTASVNGGSPITLAGVPAGETSATVDFSIEVSEANGFTVGSNAVVFTLTDAQGDAVVFAHVLTVTTFSTIDVRGDITGAVTWSAANVYVLQTRVTVLDGATLTIEPGTIIKGEEGQGAAATSLLVARGGMIMAAGTADAPIIFTSVEDEIDPDDIAAGNFASPNLEPTEAGKWGGLIVLGRAPISAQNENDMDVTEVQIEGIPSSDTNGLYGGTDEADNSGVLQYISIRHGGSEIGAGNEINGLTLGGVGTGTVIDHVEVVANADDGIEWFGGDVDMTDVLIWNSNDDALDTDQDFQGDLTNFLIVTPVGGSAFELDGPEGSTSRGNFHTFANGTVFAGDDIDHLVDWDGSTNAIVNNMYFFGLADDYTFDTSDADPDEHFFPIESFPGSVPDADAAMWTWEATMAAVSKADVFGDADGITSEVDENANTVGATDLTQFAWTWGAQSGALGGIGLQ